LRRFFLKIKMSLDSHSETETSEAVAIQDEPLREKPRVQKADSTNTRVGDTLLYQESDGGCEPLKAGAAN
jgi:hypothetical protein